MDASTAGTLRRPRVGRALLVLLRTAGAGLLVAMGWIHLYLWNDGYRDIDWIGPLFLVNVVAGFTLALAVLLTPTRRLAVVSALGALLQGGTLGALVLSVEVGLLGFVESTKAELFWQTVWVEAAGAAVLAVLAVLTAPRRGRAPVRARRVDRVDAG
jgi:hypothetical protein